MSSCYDVTLCILSLVLCLVVMTDQQDNGGGGRSTMDAAMEAQNAINTSSSPSDTDEVGTSISVSDSSSASPSVEPAMTVDTFGVPPGILQGTVDNGSMTATDTTTMWTGDQSFLTTTTPRVWTTNNQYYPPTTTADRRTFGDMFGGGGGGGYGGGGGGMLANILTPLAGAAAAALTAGGGASLLSLPNANIQPTIQKTFVVNMSPHNNPVVVQGNVHQPGATAGQTHNNNQYGRRGIGYRSVQPYPPPPNPQLPPPHVYQSKSGNDAGSKRSGRGSYGGSYTGGGGGGGGGHSSNGYVKYPDSPSFPQVAGKLGLANVLNMAKQSGLLNNLLIGGPFTFFAPSDEAFTRLPKIFLERAAENQEMMKTLFLYHLVPDTITTRHFTNDLLLPTLNTKKLRINIYQLGYKKIATVNGAVITRPDQYMINGVIHVIDRILFPVANGTLLQVMNQPNCQPFDVISTVFAIAGLYDKLDEEGPYTVFLPNTEAFGLVPADERDRLIQNATLIKEAFLYHIVPGTYYSQGLNDGQWLDTLSTFKVPVQVGMVSDGYSRRFDSVNGAVRIVKADIPAENGVIHIVDKILTPFQTYLPCLNNG